LEKTASDHGTHKQLSVLPRLVLPISSLPPLYKLQTTKGCLHIYSIYVSKDSLLPGVPAARELCKADIYLRHTVLLEREPTCITGDGKVLLIGFADGTLATTAWSGKVRGGKGL